MKGAGELTAPFTTPLRCSVLRLLASIRHQHVVAMQLPPPPPFFFLYKLLPLSVTFHH